MDPETSSPKAMTAGDQDNVGFLSLPREVRDQIYLNLVVAKDPIQYNKKFETLTRSDTFADNAMKWMFDVESNSRIAGEIRETFYQHNTFLIFTHDIPVLLNSRVHAMSFGAGKGAQTKTTYRTPFEAAAWVRKLAVRVGWHASGGWFTDSCCLNPARDLRLLLEWVSLRSVILDARFGAWSYGIPQGIGLDLFKDMKTKWGKDFKIYNNERFESDTRCRNDGGYRFDLSDVLLPTDPCPIHGSEGAETASGNSEREGTSEEDEAEQPEYSEIATEIRDEEREESDEEQEDEEQEDEEQEDEEQEDEEQEDEEQEDYWNNYWARQETARSVTWEDERNAWSLGERLIIQAGERLIPSRWSPATRS